MTFRLRYAQLPVSVKILLPLLATFLSLWIVGILGFGLLARNSLEQTAEKEVNDIATFLKKDLHQQQALLRLQARMISTNKDVIYAVATGDRNLLLRTILPIQATFQLDIVKVVGTDGQILLSSQQGNLQQVNLDDNSVNRAAQAALELSGVLPAKDAAPSSLVGLMPIKSSQKVLGGLVVGNSIDDTMLQSIRSDMSMHLIAFQGDQVTASTLPIDRYQQWSFPPSGALTWLRIKGEDYLATTVELPSFDQASLKISVLSLAEATEQTEGQFWSLMTGFGLFGAVLVTGVTIGGVRITQTLSRRIQSLTQVTQQVAAGDLAIHIPIDIPDEVGVLAQGFNQMAEQLTARDLQIKQQMQDLQQTLETLHRTQSQMVQSEKMSALGQMVAGVAHEINNPISFIHGNLGYVEEYSQDLLKLVSAYQSHYPNPPQPLQQALERAELDYLTKDLTKILQSMKVGSNRICDIILSLRNFSRLDESEYKAVNLHDGIDNTLMLLQYRLKENGSRPAIQVIKQYGDLPLVACYAGDINQVVMSIINNAIDALEESMIHDKLNSLDAVTKTIWIHTTYSTSDQVQIEIVDNAKGIPEDVRSHLFDPFFTTKPVGQGTGLGLFLSYQIVTEKHHGQLWCESTLGKGSKFIIELPVSSY